MSDSMKDLLSKRLPALFKETGFTQADLADYCGVSRTTVTSWVKGQKAPRPEKMSMIAQFFNVKASELVSRSIDPDLRPVKFLPLVQTDGSTVSSDVTASYGSLAAGIDADFIWICPDNLMSEGGIRRGDVCLFKASTAIRASHPALIMLDGTTRLAFLEQYESALYVKAGSSYRGVLLTGDWSSRLRVLGYLKALRREWRK